ncbi:hypothetical protein WEIDD23_02044 [Weissella sp. DD23]|nr:hypothetical protein WEIDD23_02044 [Weissella sp. DD23]
MDAEKTALSNAQGVYADAIAKLNDAKAKLAELQSALDDAKQVLADKKATLAEKQGALKNAQDKLAKAQQIVNAIEAEIARQKAEDEAKAEKAKQDAKAKADDKVKPDANAKAEIAKLNPNMHVDNNTKTPSHVSDTKPEHQKIVTSPADELLRTALETNMTRSEYLAAKKSLNVKSADVVKSSIELPNTGVDKTESITVAGGIMLLATATLGMSFTRKNKRDN